MKQTVHAVEYFNQRGVRLMLGATVTLLNIKDIPKIRSFANRLNINLALDAVYKIGSAVKNYKLLVNKSMFDILKFCQKANQDFHKPPKQIIHIKNKPRKYSYGRTEYEGVDLKNHLTEYRECGRKKLAILSNGDVSPCILLRQPEPIIGSLKTHTLKEILDRQTPQRKAFDEQMHLANLPICRDCEARFICKGSCVALAYAFTGSIQCKNPLYDRCYYQKPDSA